MGRRGVTNEASLNRFVGRAAELEVVSEAFVAARSGQPRVLWIEGEPGIGKTAFLRFCLSQEPDVVDLRASADESETTLDYGVVTQLMVHGRADAGSPDRTEVIGTRAPATPFSVGADLLAMLGSLQDRAPVVLTVDDAHWMDAQSAAALLFAVRRLHGDRVLVLLASRREGIARLGPSWSRLLADAERVQRVSLGGLTDAEVAELAQTMGIGPLTRAASERLREHTGGHPLYVKALLNEIPVETLNFHPGVLPAPHSFSATVLARLTDLSDAAQRLVAAAAVAGVRCQLSRAGSVAALSDPFPALEEALAADLLTLVADRLPEEISFPHPLMRAAVRDDLSPARRSALHLRWAEEIGDADALGHRAAASHGSDDDLATELQVTAEAEIADGRLAAGVERLLWASRIAESPDKRELTLLRAVECLLLAGDVPAANSRRDEVLRCGDGPRRTFTLGILMASAGDLQQAETVFRTVAARPDFALYPELEGPLASALALVYALMGREEEAIAWARRATAAPGAPPTVRVTARQARAIGLTTSGGATQALVELADLSAQRIDPAPFEAELLATRGNVRLWAGDLNGATEDLWAVLRWSRAGAFVRSLPNAYSALAGSEYHLGRWDQALAHAEVAVALGEDSARSWDLPFMHAVASFLAAGRGDWSAAREHVEASGVAAARVPVPACVYYACTAAANLAWVRTEWDLVLAVLQPLYEHPAAGRATGMGFRVPRLMRAEALIATERTIEAAAALDELEPGRDAASSDVTPVEYWRLRGELARALGESEDGHAAFERGREFAATVGSPFYAALLELSAGRFLRQNARRRDAIAALRAARQGFEQLGAEPFVGRCDTELSACGVRGQRQDGNEGYGLTAREDVVARLVAAGKSNREVAEELYLSTKAIEYHLSNVFAKVNVRSRHELASRLNASGIGAEVQAPSS
ncbi:MAG: AAA family ATPase [Solirubrobacteraceae bacterium]